MKLHDYQIVARDFLRKRGRAALFLDMGLGKTAATLSALEPRHLPALVVAPKRVAENVWPEEVPKWRPDLRIAVASGRPLDRARALASGTDVVVIGRDVLGDAEEHAPAFRTFIMDELSSFKAKRTERWKSARRIIKAMERRHGAEQVAVWGLTGTPSPNGLLDLWAQIALIDNGAALGKTLTAYRGRYFYAGRQLPSGVVIEWLLREGAEAAIHKLLEPVALSMTTDGRVNLPPVTFNQVEVPLPPAVRAAYKKMKKALVLDLSELGLLDGTVTAGSAAILSNRLAQMTAGFLYPDADLETGVRPEGYTVLHAEKLNALREIVEGTGSPVLVAYRYRAELEQILKAFPQAKTIDAPGVVQAWNRGEVPMLVAHPASAGHGLNLQHGGHTIVWTSLTWSLEEWLQFNKRLARQGQKHPVVIHALMAPRTVDQAVWDALTDKKSVQDALIDHLESPL